MKTREHCPRMYAMYKSYHVSGKGWRAFLVHGLDSLGPNFTASVCSVCDGHGERATA